MNLDIIARLVQILKEAPELGAIEVRRGLFGAWSSVRVSKAGHTTNAGGQHVIVGQPVAAAPGDATAAPAPGAPAAPPRAEEDTSALPSPVHLACPLLPEKKKEAYEIV